MGKEIRIIAGPTLEKVGDLAAILTSLSEGSILFIDECHRLNRIIEEYLYPAMEDFKLNIIIGKGPMASTMELPLKRFTLVGATTKVALISSPLRNRFGATFQLNFYETSYGSLGESRYLYHFALVENWIRKEQYDYSINIADEIGKMLWSEIKSTEEKIKELLINSSALHVDETGIRIDKTLVACRQY